MEIDIRTEVSKQIDKIIFATDTSEHIIPTRLEFADEYKEVWLRDRDDEMFIPSKEHALNLIKALNKAIELGWLK